MAGYHFDPQDYEELQNIVDFASDMVATPFDASKSYAVGEYCRRESGFYVRNTAGSGAWDASKWTPTTVGDVLKAANAEISALNATLTQLSGRFAFDNCSQYLMGVTSGGKPYWRFTDTSGNSHQLQLNASNALQYLYRASGSSSWTVVKTWS